MALSAKLFQ